ncbi:MAG: DNA repair and recombination protein RadB [Nanoarchaeota archaeon]|nr:DNA repair and recombination protein RadB [Nanoarchaeota archaeon]MBU1103652.1 DNA repair and recombination protein RadB [Nanoarchaeota archaeon]
MAKVSAGSHDLNTWLFGGYDSDIVTVLYGGPGTGKTNLCLLAAVSQAKKGKKVIFIDTEGGFSIERVKQLAPEEHEDVLKNIFLLKPTSFDEQRKAFVELNKRLKDQIDLVVVDGMTILYRLDFADAREKSDLALQTINSELARQMKTLAEIARKKNIPVLVTNQIYRWEDENRMVGGDILKYWGKCLIELVNDKGRRTVYLRKHRSLPEKSLDFVIDNKGIKRRGWI